MAHHFLTSLYFSREKYDDAISHAEQSKEYAINNAFGMAQAILLQATCYYRQGKLEKAKFEALRALEIFERLGGQEHLEKCRVTVWMIEEAERGKDWWNPTAEMTKELQKIQDVSFPESYYILRPLILPQVSSRLVRYLPPRKIPLKTPAAHSPFSVPPLFSRTL